MKTKAQIMDVKDPDGRHKPKATVSLAAILRSDCVQLETALAECEREYRLTGKRTFKIEI